MGKNGTDRVVIGVALLLLLLAGGAYYFDQWMWGKQRSRGERIGRITASEGDVRLKFQDDLKWSRASLGQDLAYDDAIYTGDGSNAKLTVGESQLTINEKSLVVLRKDQGVNFLNLTYGSVVGNVAKDEKFVIDTGDGKRMEFTATKASSIVLSRKNGRAQIDVQHGEAKVSVDGKQQVVTKSERLVVQSEPPPKKAPPVKLRALKPLSAEVVASETPRRLNFAWAWANDRRATDDETYALEFSATADFKTLHAQKKVRAALETGMDVSKTLSLYYRVRGPGGELSQTERVRFVRIEAPVIVTPVAAQVLTGAPGIAPAVDFTFRPPADATVEYQVARSADFARVLKDQHVTEAGQETLLTGDYFVRARAEYGGLGASGWTAPRPFRVEVPAAPVLANVRPTERVLIPNVTYPDELYGASPERAGEYLASQSVLADFFPLTPGGGDEVRVRVKGARPVVQTNAAWPAEHLRPGSYEYRYQTVKAGYLPGAARGPYRLEIAMEPPRPAGETTLGRRDPDGRTAVSFGFTPLLFAKTYDVQIAPTPAFEKPTELRVTEPVVKTKLAGGSYYWRARARDARDRVISDYSTGYATRAVPEAPAPVQRQLASTLTTTVDQRAPGVFTHQGWYAWLGTGENYIKYDQSIQGRAAADYHQITPGSQYVEAGYTTLTGIGGAISYKGTPGQVALDNAEVSGSSTYRWTTLALDAMLRKLSNWAPGGEPVTYGVRAGVQLHSVPFLYLDENDVLTLKATEITTAAFGVMADWSHKRWKYYSLLRYQLPLSTRTDGSSTFQMRPTFAFDGSVGASYNLTERLMLGTFWYGQWHQFNFTYAGRGSRTWGISRCFTRAWTSAWVTNSKLADLRVDLGPRGLPSGRAHFIPINCHCDRPRRSPGDRPGVRVSWWCTKFCESSGTRSRETSRTCDSG